jgi:hypothetical protein
MLNAQLAAACVTVKVCPATVTVAVRVDVVVLAAVTNVTAPLPVPVAPVETVTHPALLAAVHAHPAVVVTLMVPEPPAAANAWLAGEIVNAQPTPACVTVNVLPAMVSVPVRGVVAVEAATAKVTDAVPLPVAPVVTDSHAALLVAPQAQPAAAVTATLPVPPAAAKDCDTGEMTGTHGDVNPNVFDGRLALAPAGPTADTRVSYTTPAASGVASSDTKSTRIMPSTSRAGLPRFTVWVG